MHVMGVYGYGGFTGVAIHHKFRIWEASTRRIQYDTHALGKGYLYRVLGTRTYHNSDELWKDGVDI